jgi:hypothetical protein
MFLKQLGALRVGKKEVVVVYHGVHKGRVLFVPFGVLAHVMNSAVSAEQRPL